VRRDRHLAAQPGLNARLREHARSLGFAALGVTGLRASEHADFYRDWIAAGLHGDMHYLARPDAVDRRLDPRRTHPELRSAIVVAQPYATADVDDADADASRAIIARYARGRDYHRVLRTRLLRLLRALEVELDRQLPLARACVDTAPVLERELARRAGLGWFGRNTMLIDPRRGSYFFLGVLLVEVELDEDEPFERDHCGTCNACVDSCPTGALLGRDENGAPRMDARRCISYLTIEHRGPIPRELRPLIGNRVFGCDICQEVCPWNAPKFVQITMTREFRSDWRTSGGLDGHHEEWPDSDAPSLVELMRLTHEEWDRWTRGSAIRRAGYAGFKRNVVVALGNWLSSVEQPPEEAVAALYDALQDGEPLVREHAAWALEQLAG
jgi:epoxyqueuosine reductase